MIELHTELGRHLPPLAWWHEGEDDPTHFTERFRPPSFDGVTSKPDGGLWTAPLRDLGQGLPDSQWAHFAQSVGIKREQAYVSTVVPDPDARFVVVDTQADAVAAAQAFPPAEETTLSYMLRSQGLGKYLDGVEEAIPDPSPLMGGMLGYGQRAVGVVDWTLLERGGYAGVYLTLRGAMTCRLHGVPGVPDFYGWDVETVWFRVPLLRVGDTSRRVPV